MSQNKKNEAPSHATRIDMHALNDAMMLVSQSLLCDTEFTVIGAEAITSGTHLEFRYHIGYTLDNVEDEELQVTLKVLAGGAYQYLPLKEMLNLDTQVRH